jgi:hypothetical protein
MMPFSDEAAEDKEDQVSAGNEMDLTWMGMPEVFVV